MNISDKGIWLYYNKKGSLISKIQHGESVRQKGSFNLIVAFEDPKVLEGKKAWVAFKSPGSSVGNFIELGTYDSLDTSIFKKIKVTEMTYGLEEGKQYNVFSLPVTSDSGYTQKYGNMTVLVKLTDIDEVNNVYFQGSSQIYIEPTFGKEEDNTTITKTEYESLVNDITNRLSEKMDKYGDVAIKPTLVGTINAKTNYEFDEYGNQKITNNERDLKTHIKIHEPEENDDAANKLYVDETIKEKFDNLSASDIPTNTGDVQKDLDELTERLDVLNASKVKTDKENVSVQDSLNDLDIRLKNQNHFKGIKNDISQFNDYENYEPGDYCVVSIPDGDDIMYVWDEEDARWLEQGRYSLGIKSVNLQMPDENGNIVVNSNDIEFSDGVSVKNKITILDGEILRFKGNWKMYNPYKKNDVVRDINNIYICLEDHSSMKQPILDTSRWILFVEGFSGDYQELKNKPTDLKDFTNNGDGTTGSKYATESYVEENGGKINTLSLNGEKAVIDEEKNVDITLPTVIRIG